MALTAEQITAQNFQDFYRQILPYLNKGNGGTSDTPLGQVAFFDDLVAPYGWLVADGSTYNISDYPDLANQYERVHGSKNFYGGNGTTTFAVPNWQGEFLRASGTNSHANQGDGGTVGEHQDGTELPEVYANGGTICVGNLTGTSGNSNYDSKRRYSTTENSRSKIPATSLDEWGYIGTTRPTNTSLLLCIKAIPSSELIPRPHTWTPDVEYSFGDGLYGIRKTGTITAEANTSNGFTISTVAPIRLQHVASGGWWDIGQKAEGSPIFANFGSPVYNDGGTSLLAHSCFVTYAGTGATAYRFRAKTFSTSARENAAYDIWVLYTKETVS